MGNDEAAKVDESQTRSTDHASDWVGAAKTGRQKTTASTSRLKRSLGCGSGVCETWEAEVEDGLEVG